MKELDHLKKAWENQTFEKQFSKEELYSLLQKKSARSVKWIFYLSVIEFALYLILPVFLPNYIDSFSYYKKLHLYRFSILTTALGYAVLIYFMYRFYKNYKKISFSTSVSSHLKDILNARKTVNQYFFINIGILIVFSVVVLMSAMEYDESLATVSNNGNTLVTLIAVLVVIVALIFLIFGLIYYLVYGRFLKALKENENELIENYSE